MACLGLAQTSAPFQTKATTFWSRGRGNSQRWCLERGTWCAWTLSPTTWRIQRDNQQAVNKKGCHDNCNHFISVLFPAYVKGMAWGKALWVELEYTLNVLAPPQSYFKEKAVLKHYIGAPYPLSVHREHCICRFRTSYFLCLSYLTSSLKRNPPKAQIAAKTK